MGSRHRRVGREGEQRLGHDCHPSVWWRGRCYRWRRRPWWYPDHLVPSTQSWSQGGRGRAGRTVVRRGTTCVGDRPEVSAGSPAVRGPSGTRAHQCRVVSGGVPVPPSGVPRSGHSPPRPDPPGTRCGSGRPGPGAPDPQASGGNSYRTRVSLGDPDDDPPDLGLSSRNSSSRSLRLREPRLCVGRGDPGVPLPPDTTTQDVYVQTGLVGGSCSARPHPLPKYVGLL